MPSNPRQESTSPGMSVNPAEDAVFRRIEQEIREGLREIRFGSIEIVIQDSRVVQIERHEKVRLDPQGFRVTR